MDKPDATPETSFNPSSWPKWAQITALVATVLGIGGLCYMTVGHRTGATNDEAASTPSAPAADDNKTNDNTSTTKDNNETPATAEKGWFQSCYDNPITTTCVVIYYAGLIGAGVYLNKGKLAGYGWTSSIFWFIVTPFGSLIELVEEFWGSDLIVSIILLIGVVTWILVPLLLFRDFIVWAYHRSDVPTLFFCCSIPAAIYFFINGEIFVGVVVFFVGLFIRFGGKKKQSA